MDATYTSTVRRDPDSESGTYTDNVLDRNAVFCCEMLKEYSRKFPAWNYEKGRFTIIDSITYDGNTQVQIDFCPFCGERINYKQVKPQDKSAKRGSH